VRAPGPASGTAATLISGSTSIKLTPSAASCYDASFALPLTIEPGQYNFSIVNRLSAQAGSVSVTIIAPQPWPSKVRCRNNPYTIYYRPIELIRMYCICPELNGLHGH
jgi:hypothetical protein